MKKQYTYLLAAALAVFLIYGLYYFLRDEPIDIPKPSADKTDTRKMLMFSGNKMIEEKNGKIQWEIAAENISVNPKSRDASLQKVTAVLYQQDGSKITLKSKQGTMDSETRDITLQEDVQVEAEGQAVKLFARELKWSPAKRQLSGRDNIKIIRDDTVITGDFLEADEPIQKIKVWGNAHIVKGATQ